MHTIRKIKSMHTIVLYFDRFIYTTIMRLSTYFLLYSLGLVL